MYIPAEFIIFVIIVYKHQVHFITIVQYTMKLQDLKIYLLLLSVSNVHCYLQQRTLRPIIASSSALSWRTFHSTTRLQSSPITEPYVSEPLESLLQSVQKREPIRLSNSRHFSNRWVDYQNSFNNYLNLGLCIQLHRLASWPIRGQCAGYYIFQSKCGYHFPRPHRPRSYAGKGQDHAAYIMYIFIYSYIRTYIHTYTHIL